VEEDGGACERVPRVGEVMLTCVAGGCRGMLFGVGGKGGSSFAAGRKAQSKSSCF